MLTWALVMFCPRSPVIPRSYPTDRARKMTIQRAGLVRSEIKERLLNSSFVVSSQDSDHSLKIIFPLIGRKDRNAIAAALPLAG